jgi:hypothetical protein
MTSTDFTKKSESIELTLKGHLMKKFGFAVIGPKITPGFLLLIIATLSFTIFTGCEQPLKENETFHKVATAWPIFDLERWEGVNPEDNSTWKKEKGDAIFWLSTWEKEERYDKDDFRIYRKERNSFFPLWSTEIEESDDFRNNKGSVLIFPYESRRRK